jgi:hypothetical protein
MPDVAPTVVNVLENKDTLDWTRGIIALVIYAARYTSAGHAMSAPTAFERADTFIDEWIKRSK